MAKIVKTCEGMLSFLPEPWWRHSSSLFLSISADCAHAAEFHEYFDSEHEERERR